MGIGMRHALKPKTPSGAARFKYINRRDKYERQDDDLVFSADCNMPDFAKHDALIFWENADEYERSDARICLELELNLPVELKTVEQQIAVVETYIKQLNEKAGRFPISYAIHSDKNGTNPHVHLMLSERTLDGIERPAEQYFKRGNSKNPERGGAIKSRWWHNKQNVFWSRAAWASSCNEVLIANGHEARFDPRTKLAQRQEAIEQGDLRRAVSLSTLTETHEGPARGSIRKRLANGTLERDSVDLEILQLLDNNDTIKTFNADLQQFAITANEDQLRAFLECGDAAGRVAFIADLIEPQPQPQPAAAAEAQEPINEHNIRAATRVINSRTPDSGGIQSHEQYLFALQSCRNNELLREKKDKSAFHEHEHEQQLAGSDVRNLHFGGMALWETVQSSDRDEVTKLHNVLAERVEPEPEPQPLAAVVQPQPEAEHLTHDELFELYQNADDAADTAELQADVANCKHDDLKAQGRELIAEIKAAKPTLVQRMLIKVGLLSDRSAQLKTRVKPLVKAIKESEIEARQLDKSASALRSDADKLKIRLDLAQKSSPADEIDSTQNAHTAAQLNKPVHEPEPHEKSATASAQESLNSFFSSDGYQSIAQAEQKISEQSKVTKKSSAPRL